MVVSLIIGLVIILIGAELFTNGIEWVGKKLNLSQSAVGSILAAVGTALPESMIPVVAIFYGTGEAGHHIGVGAILGAPFMLSTLGLALVGAGALIFKKRRETGSLVVVNRFQMQRDMGFFLVFYSLAVAGAFVPVWAKYIIAAGLVVGYGYYAWLTIIGECEEMGHCPPLHLARKSEEPPSPLVYLQVFVALGLIVFGAKYFVSGVEEMAQWLGLPALIVAMILAPVATELPEKLNSIIWMRQSKDVLATGNMTGAMVFQSSLLPAFGLVFTPWALSGLGLINALLAIGAGAVVWVINNRNQGQLPAYFLLPLVGIYLVFAVLIAQSL